VKFSSLVDDQAPKSQIPQAVEDAAQRVVVPREPLQFVFAHTKPPGSQGVSEHSAECVSKSYNGHGTAEQKRT
jgi:hypothetical protein